MRIQWIATAVLVSSLACVQAADVQKRNAGLWQIVASSDASKQAPMTFKLCTDDNMEKTLAQLQNRFASNVKDNCSKLETHTKGAQVITDSVCTAGPSQLTTHMVATLNNASFKIDVHTHRDPSPQGNPDFSTNLEGTWVGVCTADMKPGDMMLPNGFKVNLGGAIN
jgi:Protein of unknown function (DUF3617)